MRIQFLILGFKGLRACEKRKLPKIVSKLMVEVTKRSFSVKFSSYYFLFKGNVPVVDVKMAVARTVPASMEERVTRPVTSWANVSRVNAVRMLQETSVKLVQH